MSNEAAESGYTPKGMRKRGKMRGRNKILLILLSLVLMGTLRTGFIFIIIGLLPAIVTYFIDRSFHQYTFKCVFSCNLSALLPSISKMIVLGPSSTVMQAIMGDGLNWLMIYGAALFGLMLVSIMSSFAQLIVSGFHQAQVEHLNQNQKKIETEWGGEVMQFSQPDYAADQIV